ncbi:NADPH-dependent glutamate synthase [candidate division NPL-UPA2 bacterium]|nr:NADPH-dependent glutamate synthase [candidate division NPL-UPA2 bacterium]
MPEQDPRKRIHNFDEVARGYSEEMAISEAERCLNCKKPQCVRGCPVEIDILGFLNKIKEKDFQGAISLIKEKNSLPAVCGRVCPQETQCEEVCILAKKQEPVAIGRLERFTADWEVENSLKFKACQSPGQQVENLKRKGVCLPRIAVVGSGPAGLTCAGDLAKMGYQVTIFESLSEAGGVLRYGIPEFRLPKGILDRELDYIKELGVEIRVNMVIGMLKGINDLFCEGYQAVFIGTGAGLPFFMQIPGENLNGVYSANEFLTRINLMKANLFPEYETPVGAGEKVAVIGAGNVALDAARCARRLGVKEVSIVYRRSEKEMPARWEEINHAREEGIKFKLLTAPVSIRGNGSWVEKMKCIKMELGKPDESGRCRPLPLKGSEFEMEVDTIVVAIGQGANPLLLSRTSGLKLNKRGYIETNEEGATSLKGVFAGGDIVTGAATVISAMGAGKRAARTIDRYINCHKTHSSL